MNKAYSFDYDNKKMVETEVNGQVIYTTEVFDEMAVMITVPEVSFTPNMNLISSTTNTRQMPFVVNVPFEIDVEEDWTETNLIPAETLKPGDTVYVYLGDDDDPYGIKVLGVFSRKLTEDEVKKLQNYCEKLDIWNVKEEYTTELTIK